ncbi:MAG: hypothetical protein C0425_09180 [Chlorobiaceae bacterium]|nr:hypothetical protein [Chlorobiaceae bacterium]MBA4310494.1 hypothetical protein [Chlorobiaceae bacterium]
MFLSLKIKFPTERFFFFSIKNSKKNRYKLHKIFGIYFAKISQVHYFFITKIESLMKNLFLILLLSIICIGESYAQVPRARIHIEVVTPDTLLRSGFTTNSVATGLRIVPVETFVYLGARNIASSPQAITGATFTFVSRPSGSTASINIMTPTYINFLADRAGEYVVKLDITTAGGTDDTTITIVSARYIGVGGFDGGATAFPQCMSCHAAHPKFVAIYDRWKVSSHALMARKGIRGDLGTSYDASCLKCHTTGNDHNIAANNDGFDDIQRQVSWTFTSPSVARWDALRASNSLLQRATIGCESCHGPGSAHTMGGAITNTQISYDDGTCGTCHDSGTRYNKYREWKESDHFTPIWSGSFAQATASQNNSLGNCIRCHDGRGYVNFTYNRTTNTTGMNSADQIDVGCVACHDPHGNGRPSSLRVSPATSDTLSTGFKYTAFGGKGKTCMDCHKSRRSIAAMLPTTVAMSSTWGPHRSVQTDVLLGQNAAAWDANPYVNTIHNVAITDGCVTCHMGSAPAIGNVNRDKVAGHTMRLRNFENNYTHTASCTGCHPQRPTFDSFVADRDYDGDGTIEPVQAEVSGLLRRIRIALPPVGVDSIAWASIGTDQNLRRAYWNYQLIFNDNSLGMHNTKFTFAVLTRTLQELVGVSVKDEPVEVMSFSLAQNYPNPFNPSTKIQFVVAQKSNIKIEVFTSNGELVNVLVNESFEAGNHSINWNARANDGTELTSGVYLYRMISDNNVIGTKKMLLIR